MTDQTDSGKTAGGPRRESLTDRVEALPGRNPESRHDTSQKTAGASGRVDAEKAETKSGAVPNVGILAFLKRSGTALGATRRRLRLKSTESLSRLKKSDLPSKISRDLRQTGGEIGQAGRARWIDVKRFTMAEFLPRAVKTGRNFRARTRRKVLHRDYHRGLRKLHNLTYDRPVEKLFFVPTDERISLSRLTVDSPNADAGYGYHTLPRAVFRWSLSPLQVDPGLFTFVDYGAGRGRILLLAAQFGFKKIIGVEYARELHDDAQMNIAQFPRSLMKCRNVDCILADAVNLPVPSGRCIFYFNTPFVSEILAQVVQNITRAYKEMPRRMYLVFVGPPHRSELNSIMDTAGIFEKLPLSRAARLRLVLLSPDRVEIYRTLK